MTARVLAALDGLGAATPNTSGLPIIEVPLADHSRSMPSVASCSSAASTSPWPPTRWCRRTKSASASRSPPRTPTSRSRSLIDVLGDLADRFPLQPARDRGRQPAWSERHEPPAGRSPPGRGSSTSGWRSSPRASTCSRRGSRATGRCSTSSRASSVSRDPHRHPHLHRPAAPWLVAMVRDRPGAVLPRRRLHLQLSDPDRPRGAVPVCRGRPLPPGVPGADDGRAAGRTPPQPAGRSRGRHRRADHHRRHRAPVLGLT